MSLSIALLIACTTYGRNPAMELSSEIDQWIAVARTTPPEELRNGPAVNYWLWKTGLSGDLIQKIEVAQKDGVPVAALKTCARKLIHEFGTNPVYDFRLHLCLDHVLDPAKNVRETELQELFAEVQVMDWLRHPEKVERCAWFIAWRAEGKIPAHNWEYAGRKSDKWRKTRLLMLLMCMTGCQDLYIGKEPEVILQSYARWHRRLSAAVEEQRVSRSGYAPAFVIHPKGTKLGDLRDPMSARFRFVPRVPFPDWDTLPAPVTPRVFRELQ